MGRILPTIGLAIAMAISHGTNAVARNSNQGTDATIDAVSVNWLNAQQRRDLVCMSRNIYHEARGSTQQNQLAVALVVRNRQRLTGQSACQVIYAPGQFSWTSRRHGPPAERQAWRESQRIAYMVLFSEDVEDITMGATHFHETTMRPVWALRATQRMVIGAHAFLRIHGYDEVAEARD